MDRRRFLLNSLAGAVAAPLAPAAAQPLEKVPRVGFLGPRTRSHDAGFVDAFLQGLRDLGWVEGKTIVIEYRWAEGRSERLPDLAAELVRLKVDVIFAGNTAVAVAAKNATRTIPIVPARAMGVQLQLLKAGGPNEFQNAFAAMPRERAEALLVMLDPFFGFHRAGSPTLR